MKKITELLAEDLGNGKAFYKRFMSWARIVVGEDYAEDAYSQFLLKMQIKQENYWNPVTDLEDKDLLKWIRTIFYHTLIDVGREKSKQRRRIASIPVEEYELKSQEEEYDHDFIHDATRRVLSCLPEDQQRLIREIYMGGLSYRQASEKLGVPIGTVKSRVNYAKATALKRNKRLVELLNTK